MKIDLTIQQYAYLRAIHELKGDCDSSMMQCSECPLKLGIEYARKSYISKDCVAKEIRYKIATEILSFDQTIKETLVEDKL